MTLRPTQIETLRVIDRYYPDGASAWEIALEFGISLRSAEGRLERLEVAQMVRLCPIQWPFAKSGKITLALLTNEGREAIR